MLSDSWNIESFERIFEDLNFIGAIIFTSSYFLVQNVIELVQVESYDGALRVTVVHYQDPIIGYGK